MQGNEDRDIKKKLKPRKSDEDEYELSRYKPLLRTVLEVRIQTLSILPVF